jgi:hypothetical protein
VSDRWTVMDAGEKDLRLSGQWGIVQLLNDPNPDVRAMWISALSEPAIRRARAAEAKATALRGEAAA